MAFLSAQRHAYLLKDRFFIVYAILYAKTIFLLHLCSHFCRLASHMMDHLRNGLLLGLLRPRTETHMPKSGMKLEEPLANAMSSLGLLGPKTGSFTPKVV